jgi:hypothetical protein
MLRGLEDPRAFSILRRPELSGISPYGYYGRQGEKNEAYAWTEHVGFNCVHGTPFSVIGLKVDYEWIVKPMGEQLGLDYRFTSSGIPG